MNKRITFRSHDADYRFCPDLTVEYREECDKILTRLNASIKTISDSGVRGKEFKLLCEIATIRAIQELKNVLSEATRLRALGEPTNVAIE
jgi:hypothetical protein